jgi:hypothetical protein
MMAPSHAAFRSLRSCDTDRPSTLQEDRAWSTRSLRSEMVERSVQGGWLLHGAAPSLSKEFEVTMPLAHRPPPLTRPTSTNPAMSFPPAEGS